MADEKQSTSALMRRHEQLKRWEESDTNKAPIKSDADKRKVKFHDGCVFLAACSSGDREEVKRLLDRGADINTANVDGLTALHQACIDDNLDMVEFLVEHSADVDVCDNEGWTPLHATASCGFSEIARFLLSVGANVAAVNNDGDLPYDICEDDEMERLLQEAMEKQGIDADAARREEEDLMMADANQWLNSKIIEDKIHSKTGASSLHVASAKGYTKVMNVLLQAGLDINAKDIDGWTPLHAAAHWGQEEACKILAEHMCDMECKNHVGQTAFDVADTDIIKLLEELKLKQASLKDQQKDLQKDIIQTKAPSSRRRSSVTRMSVEQKQNVMKTVEQERVTLDNSNISVKEKEEEKLKSSSSSGSEEESSESETEKKNEINKQTSGQNQPRDRDKPPVMTTVEIKAHDMPRIDETNESPEKENLKNLVGSTDNGLAKVNDVIGDSLNKVVINDKSDVEKEKDTIKDKEKEMIKDKKVEEKETEQKEKLDKDSELIEDKDLTIEKEKEKERENDKENIDSSPSKKGSLQRTISAPPTVSEVPKISLNSKPVKDGENDAIPSWRAGLRKTGSTSMVHDSVNKINELDKNLPRSASSPRLAEENKKNEKDDKTVSQRPYSVDTNNSSLTDRYGSTSTSQSRGLSGPYNRYSSGSLGTGYQSAYVPYYRRQQEQNDRKEKDRVSSYDHNSISNRISTPSSLSVTSSSLSGHGTITSPISTSSSSSNSTPTSPYSVQLRKSYEPPKRDEETEMQRKVRAKRARETRRSTQGVTLEEIKQAEKELKKSDSVSDKSKMDDSSKTSQEKPSSDVSERVKDATDSSRVSGSNADTTLSSRLSSVEEKDKDKDSLSSISSWRRSRTENLEGLSSSGSKDDETRSSFRRSRHERDLSSSAPSGSLYSSESSTYVPRSQRTALSADVGNTSLASSSGGLTRSTSLRTPRIRDSDDSTVDLTTSRRERDRDRDRDRDITSRNSTADKADEKREMSSVKSRRLRRERRSTGINYNPENEDEERDKDKENKDESKDDKKSEKNEEKTEEKISYRRRYSARESGTRFNRYPSASDMPSHISDRTYIGRPSSYTENTSRSTSSVEKDYKKLYEEEKSEKERIKRDLDNCKRELKEAKTELDRLMRRNEASRTSDTNDKREKRALERKLSELEEEVKKIDQLQEDNRRLREENGALIRVISKLSK